MKRLAIFATLGFLAFAGCQNEMPSAPQQSSPVEGNWNYIATDGQDLSDYGITYSFSADKWVYTLGDAGAKQYQFRTNGDTLTATLIADGMHSSDAIGSQVTSIFNVRGDTLEMQTGGHTAILARQ
jgi:hypothetical protein